MEVYLLGMMKETVVDLLDCCSIVTGDVMEIFSLGRGLDEAVGDDDDNGGDGCCCSSTTGLVIDILS
jgi:hypothetical protein